jgi:dipeptidyl aminopeptidase/acylaminoacyl peptidase
MTVVTPSFATHAPDRAVGTSEVDGRPQVTTWERGTGRRQLTTSAQGVELCEIEPDGRHVWWFEAGPDGTGTWWRAPFEGGAPRPALTGVPAGRGYGVAFDGAGGVAAVGVGVGGWSRCYLGTPGGAGRLLFGVPGYRCVVDLTADATLLVLAGPPDSVDAALVVATGTGRIVARIAGTPERRVWPLEFRPDGPPGPDRRGGPGGPAEPELLLAVAVDGRYTLVSWRPTTGTEPHEWLSFDSEVTASWYGTGRTLLVQHDRAGHSRLLLAALDRRQAVPLATPEGSIAEVTGLPDGRVHYLWSRAGTPPRLLTTSPAHRDPPEVPAARHHRELWTERPYGRIHSFVAIPPGTAGPWPVLFLVHGGPATHDRDAYDPRVEAFAAAGFAVVRANYRGSTGYGPGWQHAAGTRSART